MAPQTSLASKAITTKPSLNGISISLIPLMSKHVFTGSTWQPLCGWQESSISVKRNHPRSCLSAGDEANALRASSVHSRDFFNHNADRRKLGKSKPAQWMLGVAPNGLVARVVFDGHAQF